MSFEAGEQSTPQEKIELQRARYELGLKMARLIKRRSQHERHDTIHDRENDEAEDTRKAVWAAEYAALMADPTEEFGVHHVPKEDSDDQ